MIKFKPKQRRIKNCKLVEKVEDSILIRIPSGLKAALKKRAAKEGTTVSKLIRGAMCDLVGWERID